MLVFIIVRFINFTGIVKVQTKLLGSIRVFFVPTSDVLGHGLRGSQTEQCEVGQPVGTWVIALQLIVS